MTRVPYDTLAGVYEWLVPDALLTPEGSAAAFADTVQGLEPGARILDCACGTGQLAVGLALRGYAVTAADASAGMTSRAGALAAEHGARLEIATCAWDALPEQDWDAFDAVLCVGNSLTHAPGRPARRRALAAMAGVLAASGHLTVTSRNWELVRRDRPGLEVGDRLVERRGGSALVVRSWTIPEDWESPHGLETAVVVLDETGGARTRSERLPFWPFPHEALDEDLRACGLQPERSTWAPEAERDLVVARRDAS